jgi:hypothetical protein
MSPNRHKLEGFSLVIYLPREQKLVTHIYVRIYDSEDLRTSDFGLRVMQ